MTADEEARISGFDIDALIDGGGFASFGHVTSYYNGVLATAPTNSVRSTTLVRVLDEQTSKRCYAWTRGCQHPLCS